MSNQAQSSNDKYDLEERTAKFAENVIDFLKSLPLTPINKPYISQVARSSGSICANYCEADAAQSKKDFQHKVAICKKEAKETRVWFRLLAKANPDRADSCRILWQEAHELLLIFSKILKTSKE